MRYINSSGSIVSASNYDSANMHMKADTTKDEDKFQNGAYSYSGAIIGNYENGGGVHWIYNPFSSSSYTFMTFEGAGGYDSSSNKTRSQKGIGILKQTGSAALKAEITALESLGLGKTISNPKIFTLDNQVATITQVEEIPYA